MSQPDEIRNRVNHWLLPAVGIGAVGLILCVVGVLVDPAQFFRSYLFGYLFWLSIALGSLGILMVHHMTGGAWGFVIRRLLEGAAMTLPWMALLFVPLLFGLPHLFGWMQPGAMADEELRHKSHFFLNEPWFIARAALYFIVWGAIAVTLRRWSLAQDRTGDPAITERFQLFCGPALVLYVFTYSFAAIDWIMTLEPHWYSTIFGMIVITGQGLAALAFAILVASTLILGTPLKESIPDKAFHDLGNLLLTFVLLWAYMSYSQYIIIWSGNLSTESLWYVHRGHGGWPWIGLALILFHFFLPFVLLVFGGLKRSLKWLAMIAAGVLLAHLVDEFWLVLPSFYTAGLRLHWLDIAAPLAIGGIWISLFVLQVRDKSLVPLHDPRLQGLFDVSKVTERG